MIIYHNALFIKLINNALTMKKINNLFYFSILFFFVFLSSIQLLAQDADLDNVMDEVDLDDDNDGILDEIECFTQFTIIQGSDLGLSTGNNQTVTDIDVSSLFKRPAGSILVSASGIDVNSNDVFFLNSGETPEFTISGDVPVYIKAVHGGIISGANRFDGIKSLDGTTYNLKTPLNNYIEGDSHPDYSVTRSGGNNDGNGDFIWESDSEATGIQFNTSSNGSPGYFVYLRATGCIDSDGDGVDNKLDVDSDGDGCPDAIEGGASFDNNHIFNDTLIGGVNTEGVPYMASSIGQPIGQSINSSLTDVNCSALPVELTFFEATNVNCTNILSWETASEENNSHFVIQYSDDGIFFKDLDEELGKGFSTELIQYHYDHMNIESILYYRLKQVDFDGAYTYSEIVSVKSNCNEKFGEVKIYPNPTQSIINANINIKGDINTEITIKLLDNLGRTKFVKQFTSFNGQNIEKLDMNDFAPGLYYFTIDYGNGQSDTVKILKQ